MGTHLLLTAWTFDPITLIGLALMLGAYLYAVGPLRRRLLAAPSAASFATQTAPTASATSEPSDSPGDLSDMASDVEEAYEASLTVPTRKVAYFVAGWALL